MEDKKYPCRTEVVTGITYRIKFFLDGQLRGSTSFEDKETADRFVKSMSAKLPNYNFEVTSSPWTNNVCIECGREEY